MTADPNERHGIKHYSISSLRNFTENTAVWVAKYLHGVKDDAGPAAWRGIAVEAGLARLLYGEGEEAASRTMRIEWDNKAMGLVDDKALKESDALLQFLTQGMLAFHGKPKPLQAQAKISITIPGITVPLIGFSDFLWAEGYGCDLKTTWKIPGEPTPAHIQQVSAYSLFHGVPFELVYVSPKRWVRYEIAKATTDEAWQTVVEAAHALQSFLAHARDADDALSMVAPNYSSYLMSEEMTVAIRAAKARINNGKE